MGLPCIYCATLIFSERFCRGVLSLYSDNIEPILNLDDSREWILGWVISLEIFSYERLRKVVEKNTQPQTLAKGSSWQGHNLFLQDFKPPDSILPQSPRFDKSGSCKYLISRGFPTSTSYSFKNLILSSDNFKDFNRHLCYNLLGPC